jgi:primosomal protein N'
MHYYEIAPTKIFRAGVDVLTYEHEAELPPGTIVTIPLGKKTITGLITKKVNKPNFPTKPNEKILVLQPLPSHLLKALLWISEYYACPLPTVLQSALPRGVEKQRREAKSEGSSFSERRASPVEITTITGESEGRVKNSPASRRNFGDPPEANQTNRSDFDIREQARGLKKSSAGDFATITTLNIGEDWICRELNECKKELDKLIGKYRFAEAVELLYDTIWNKYADWFLESQKIYKNTPLLQKTLEHILILLHPFAPFVTETIWQTLSWTDGLLINQKLPDKLTYDPMTAEQFETLMTIVSTVRGHLQRLPCGQKPNLLFGNDSLVNDHQVLIQFFTHVPAVIPDDTPQGMRIALQGREIYLDIDAETLRAYRQNLEVNILKLGAEIDRLNLRLMNPNYIQKAPEELVKETEDQLAEKQATLARLKNELTFI